MKAVNNVENISHGINTNAKSITRKINTAHVVLGNTGEINNVCIEFPLADLQLKHWAQWRRNGCSLKELDYPTSSSHMKLPGGSFNEIPDDPNAERMDKLVSELSRKYSDIYIVLRSRYFYCDNDRDGSSNCKITRRKYQMYLKIGIAWIDRGLFELQ